MLLLQLLINGAVNAAIISLLAVGFGMVYRSMRFFHIGYGAIYLIAPFAVISLSTMLPTFLAVPAGLVAAMLAGILAEGAVYAPLRARQASREILFIASLGIYILAVNSIALLYGNEVQMLSHGIGSSLSIGPVIVTNMQMFQFFLGWAMVIGFWIMIRKSTFFKAIWALGETPDLITALGFPVQRMRYAIVGLSSLFAGSAALPTAYDIGIDPHSGMSALLSGAVAVLVGGTNHYWGWIGGATLLALLQSLAVWQFSSRWVNLVTFSVLVLTLLFRPHGLFSFKQRREEQ